MLAKSAVVVSQSWLLERLGLVKSEPVQSANLVSVLVFFGSPESAVPMLAIA